MLSREMSSQTHSSHCYRLVEAFAKELLTFIKMFQNRAFSVTITAEVIYKSIILWQLVWGLF